MNFIDNRLNLLKITFIKKISGILFFTLIILFHSCLNQKKIIQSNKSFVFNTYDSVITVSLFDKYQKFYIIYSGPISDNYILSNKHKPVLTAEIHTYSKKSEGSSFQISVMTQDTIVFKELTPKKPPIPPNFIADSLMYEYDKTVGKYALPIIIRNTASDSLALGFGNEFYEYEILAVIEVEVMNGVWRRVTRSSLPDCLTGMNEIILPQNNILITPLIINKYGVEMKCRIKLLDNDSVISNEFILKIPEEIIEQLKN